MLLYGLLVLLSHSNETFRVPLTFELGAQTPLTFPHNSDNNPQNYRNYRAKALTYINILYT